MAWIVRIVAGFCAVAASNTVAAAEMVARHYRSIDGLPVSSATSAAIDGDGFLWLATHDGLARFDGREFTIYDAARFPEMGGNRVAAVYRDVGGGIYALGAGGEWLRVSSQRITRWRPAGAQIDERVRYVHPDPLCVTATTGMYCAGADDMVLRRPFVAGSDMRLAVPDGKRDWLLQQGRGMVLCEAATCQELTTPIAIAADAAPTALMYERRLLVGAIAGLLEIASDGSMQWLARTRDPTFDLLQLRLEPDGTVLAGSGSGLFRIHDGQWLPAWDGSDGRERLSQSWRDPQGALWHSEGGNLFRERRLVLKCAGRITSVLFAPGQLAIVTTLRDGVYILAAPRVDLVGDGEMLRQGNLYGLTQAVDGSMWMGSLGGGLYRLWPDGRQQRYNRKDGLPGDHIWGVAQASDRSIYAASYLPGLWRLSDGAAEFHHVDAPEPLNSAQIRAFSIDAAGALWVGGSAGAWQLTATGWQQRWPVGAPANVLAIAHAPDGTIWYGGDLGLWRQDARQSWAVAVGSLQGARVRGVFRDSAGAIWASSEGRGLLRVDSDDPHGERAVRLGRAEGLPSNSPHAVIEDAQGNLWVNSNQGIFRITRAALSDFLQGRSPSLSPLTLGLADGLTELEGNGGVQPAVAVDPGGRIWFPSQHGVVRFNPLELPLRSDTPRAVVDGLDGAGLELNLSDQTLPLGVRAVQIRYNAADLHAGAEVRFRYRLTPIDEQWTEAGTRHVAAFAALAPGSYGFEVVAGNSDGLWATESAKFAFNVPAYVHETRAFQWSLGIGVLLLIAGLAQLRVDRLRRRAVALDAQVRIRTQELSTEKERVEATLADLAQAHDQLALTHEQIESRNRRLADQASRLEALDGFRTRLLANVSHELRTPLMLIKLPLRDAIERAGELDASVRQRLQLPLQQTERLGHLVEQLVDLVQAEVGHLRLSVRRLDLLPWARTLLAGFQPIADQQRRQLQFQADVDSLVVYADSHHLATVLTNLLDNALKYAPSDSAVILTITVNAAGEWVRVSVTDFGPGYPPELATSLFDRFFRADGPPRAGREGLGIGLALARELVELHGGRIGTTAGSSAGTMFWFELPLGSAHVALDEITLDDASARSEPAAVAAGEGGILLVEDHPELAAYLGERLAESFPVRVVADAESALRDLGQHQVRLLISDVKLPGMDGVELCRQLKAMPRYQQLPIILISAKSTAADRRDGVAAGASAWITKPFELGDLLTEIRRHWPAETSAPASLAANDVALLGAQDPLLRFARSMLADASFGVAEWALSTHLSDRQLRRRVSELTGVSPIVWLREQRLCNVRQLISGGTCQTLAEAGLRSGFDNPNYLYRLYRARFGES